MDDEPKSNRNGDTGKHFSAFERGSHLASHGITLMACYALLSLATILVGFSTILDFSVNGMNIRRWALTGFFVLALVVSFVLLLRKYMKRPELVFLLVGIPAAFSFCMLLLPNAVPDEIWHIFRVFDFTNPGDSMVVPTALVTDLPRSYSDLGKTLATPTDYSSTFPVERDMTAYMPHLYFLPGVVCLLGKMAGLNVFCLVYLARAVNACLFLVAGYWCIKLTPIGKTLFFVYLLNPMLIQQEASCSADALTNIIALLFIAILMMARFGEKVTIRQLTVLLVLIIGLLLSKFAYAPLALLMALLLPKVTNPRIKRDIVAIVLVVLIGAIVYCVGFYQSSSPTISYALGLIRDPLYLLLVVGNTILQFGGPWIEEFGGASLGSLNISVWLPLTFLYLALLLMAVFNSLGEKHSLRWGEKLFIWVLVTFIMCLVIVVFRQWSVEVVGLYDSISGVQGRYFMPLIILLLLTGIDKNHYILRENCLAVYSVLLICVYLGSLCAVCAAFL